MGFYIFMICFYFLMVLVVVGFVGIVIERLMEGEDGKVVVLILFVFILFVDIFLFVGFFSFVFLGVGVLGGRFILVLGRGVLLGLG